MSDLHPPHNEAAVASLASNAEHRMAGAEYLRWLIGTRVGGETTLVRRWQKCDAVKRPVRWRVLLTAVVVLAGAGVEFSDFTDLLQLTGGDVSQLELGFPGPEERISSKLDPAERIIVFGDRTIPDPFKRTEILWRRYHPEDPAYFPEYVKRFIDRNQALPGDFLTTARRIYPDNAWFTYVAAAVEGQLSAKETSSLIARSGGKLVGTLSPREIDNQAWFDRAIEYIREAGGQSKYDNYRLQMLRGRISVLPQKSLRELRDSLNCLGGTPPEPSLRPLVSVISTKAWIAFERKDELALVNAISDGERFIDSVFRLPPRDPQVELDRFADCDVLAECFGSLAESMGMSEQAGRWKEVESRLKEWNAMIDPDRGLVVDGVEAGINVRNGILMGGLLSYRDRVANPPTVTDPDLKPGRLIDHEVFSRLCCYAAFMFMGTMIGFVALFRYRVTRVTRLLAMRFDAQLMPADWLWTIGLGMLMPLAYVLAINRLTPLGGRNYGVAGTMHLLPTAQFAGLIVLWLAAPIPVIRWRLGQQLELFGFGHERRWTGWLAIASAAAFVPAIGWAALNGTIPESWLRETGISFVGNGDRVVWDYPFWVAACLLAVPVSWLLGLVFAALLGGTRDLLQRACHVRMLMPTYAAGMVFLLGMIFFFKAAERHWFGQENLLKLDPASSSTSRYEHMVALRLREEFLEAINLEPEKPSANKPTL